MVHTAVAALYAAAQSEAQAPLYLEREMLSFFAIPDKGQEWSRGWRAIPELPI